MISKKQLQDRIQALRQPIIEWLQFYNEEPDLSEKSDQELMKMLMKKIDKLRNYSYKQNEFFEKMLGHPTTGQNEDRNAVNWNIIVDIIPTRNAHNNGTIGNTV
ncbi:MAG TPA: hypothetical protein VJ583_09540 [Nitrososphaeraceae archaeon]|nr:hypothetical protein [Nitrososphaeraceae archaeon]